MRALLWSVLVACLAGCPPGPVSPPPPDASDGSAPVGDAGLYAACCARMHDVAPECPATLAHVAATHVAVIPEACRACGLACAP